MTNKPMLPLVYLALAMLLFVQRVDGRRCFRERSKLRPKRPVDAGRMFPIQRVCRHLAAVGLIAIDGTQSARYGLAFGTLHREKRRENVVRRLIAALAVLVFLSVAGAATKAAQSDLRVILIGTGIPVPDADRSGPATLVEAGEQKLLFDAGRGTTPRLWQLKIPLSRVAPLFLTHLHSDHVVGIPDLWLTGWLGGPFGRRTTPFYVIGPPGTKNLMSNLERAYAADIQIRIADEKYPPEGVKVITEEFGTEGVVYERDGVRVTAFEVDHGEDVKPAYGYRVDYKGHSIVISGDTRFSENVIKYGTEVDVLVHEVAVVRPELLKDQQVQRVMAHHTSPQEAGTVFSRSRPKLAVYTHLVLLDRPTIPRVTIDELVAQTRETYGGPLEVGEDLMSIEIDDTGHPTVQRRQK